MQVRGETLKKGERLRTVRDLCLRSDHIAREKGWYDGQEHDDRPMALVTGLFHSEVSEALEEWRAHRKADETYFEPSGKPCGIGIELADVVIRICQRAGKRGGDLEEIMDTDKRSTDDETPLSPVRRTVTEGRDAEEAFPALLADVHACLSMAYVCYHSTAWQDLLSRQGLPCTPMRWWARVLNRIFAYAKETKLDLWSLIEMKEDYNAGRSFRHGGKKA
jgi:hypothetical protein